MKRKRWKRLFFFLGGWFFPAAGRSAGAGSAPRAAPAYLTLRVVASIVAADPRFWGRCDGRVFFFTPESSRK